VKEFRNALISATISDSSVNYHIKRAKTGSLFKKKAFKISAIAASMVIVSGIAVFALSLPGADNIFGLFKGNELENIEFTVSPSESTTPTGSYITTEQPTSFVTITPTLTIAPEPLLTTSPEPSQTTAPEPSPKPTANPTHAIAPTITPIPLQTNPPTPTPIKVPPKITLVYPNTPIVLSNISASTNEILTTMEIREFSLFETTYPDHYTQQIVLRGVKTYDYQNGTNYIKCILNVYNSEGILKYSAVKGVTGIQVGGQFTISFDLYNSDIESSNYTVEVLDYIE
jgi:hypothetical protein